MLVGREWASKPISTVNTRTECDTDSILSACKSMESQSSDFK